MELNKFELQVTEKNLGSLTTNALSIKEEVTKALSVIKTTVYNDDNIADAKKDKAMLNKASKALNDERIKIGKEFVKPFDDFKSVVDETIKLIKDASNEIDVVVKSYEDKEKEIRLTAVKDLWAAINSEVPFEKVLNDKWLLKTAKLKDIEDELNSIDETINNYLISIDTMQEYDTAKLKDIYLKDLDYNKVIQAIELLKVMNTPEPVVENPTTPTPQPCGEVKAPVVKVGVKVHKVYQVYCTEAEHNLIKELLKANNIYNKVEEK